MRVLNVVSVLSSREGGGNAERTLQLSKALATAGVRCAVLTLNIGTPEASRVLLGSAELVVLPCINKRFQVPALQWRRLVGLVREADIIHLMGYWSLLGVLIGFIARREGIPYVLSPAGALPLFGRSQFLKRAFNLMMGQRLISSASGWIAVTASELPDFIDYGVDPRSVAILPNGVVETDFDDIDGYIFSGLKQLLPERYILFMGRLNRIKGPDLLIDAFARISDEFSDLALVFAGPDEGMQAELQQRAAEIGINSKVRFVGFVSGTEKVALYRSACLLVVPSRLEAMSIVAVEAGVCGLPVLMTDQCGLPDLQEIESGLVVPATSDALAKGLHLALSDPVRLCDWGTQWQGLVRQRFLWRDICQRFVAFLAPHALVERG